MNVFFGNDTNDLIVATLVKTTRMKPECDRTVALMGSGWRRMRVLRGGREVEDRRRIGVAATLRSTRPSLYHVL